MELKKELEKLDKKLELDLLNLDKEFTEIKNSLDSQLQVAAEEFRKKDADFRLKHQEDIKSLIDKVDKLLSNS